MATGTPLVLAVTITEFNLPLTDITWFIDGTPATGANERISITNTSTATPPAFSTLTLDPVQFPAEGGLYSVTVVNPAGMDTTAFNVTVSCKQVLFHMHYKLKLHMYKFTIAPAVLIFPNAPVALTVTEGDQTILTCTARGVPAPEFMWYRGSELINGLDTRLQVLSSHLLNYTTGFIYITSLLNVTVVDRNDTSVFRCDASNILLGVSLDVSQSYNVTVYCKLWSFCSIKLKQF